MAGRSHELDGIVNDITARLSEKYRARERGLEISRGVIRRSANAIRAVHRREFDVARSILKEAKDLLAEAETGLDGHHDIYYAGFIPDAQKEYAEAWTTLALATGGPLPTPKELGIGDAPYLNGLGEAVGEMRRHLLDMIRRGELDGCEEVLTVMDDVYSILVTIDFPDAMTGGLRRTTDSVRGILERTRGDVTLAVTSQRLERRLAGVDEEIKAGGGPSQ